jgi:hypothetical protein
MLGACVQVSGKRGLCTSDKAINEKILVSFVDETRKLVQKSHCAQVYCLGLPREVLKVSSIQTAERCSFQFVPLLLREKDGVRITMHVNRRFFPMALTKMKTKTKLLRLYIADYSQDDSNAKIIFDLRCINPYMKDDLPWFYDMDENEFRHLAEAGPPAGAATC